MKHMTRKFLSLLMVLAMLLTMVPAAFAVTVDEFDWDDEDCFDIEDYEDYEEIKWDDDECPDNDDGEHDDWDYEDEDDWDEPTCDEKGRVYVYCDCGEEGYFEVPKLDHDWDPDPVDYDDEDHQLECVECGETKWFEHDDDCDCLDDEDEDEDEDSPEYVYIVDDDGKLVIEVDDDTDDGLYVRDDEDILVYIEDVYFDDDDLDIDDYDVTFEWEGDFEDEEDDDTSSEAYVVTEGDTAEITCTITVTDGTTTYEGSVEWKLKAEADVVVDVVVYNDTELSFDEADEEGNDSVLDQILAGVEDLDEDYTFQYIKFEDNEFDGGELEDVKTSKKYYDEDAEDCDEDYLLSDVVFIPDEDYEGSVVIDVEVTYLNARDSKKTATGTINIEVKEGGTGLGIVLTGKAGEEIEVDEELFADFWEEAYEDGELEKVKITSVSKGTLYYDYDGDDEAKLTGKTLYTDPTSKQMGLENLTYVPAKNTTSVTIKFTASGVDKKDRDKSADGEITILLTDGKVEPIVYEHTGSAILLDPDDFTDLYKDVMDVAKVSNLQVQFLEAPENGTLYANYNAKTGKGTALTERSVGTYKFSTTNLAKVAYVPAAKAGGDTVKIACYSGSTLKFLGTVEFGKSEPIKLTKISTTDGLAFTVADFFAGDLASVSYFSFGTPTSGALYMNYNGTTGTKVSSGLKFAAFSAPSMGYYNINTVTFVPSTSGKATIPFTATTYDGKTQEGTLEITTVVNRFKDLKATDWYYSYVMKLAGLGVVGGDDKGNINAGADVKYGEALKMIMKAVGYADQAPTGTHWASGYLTKAAADGLIASTTNLEAKATRNNIAIITAKAMKLSTASSVNAGISAPIDTNNGYVLALYNAGILTGSFENGVNYYKPADQITRAEIFAIVSRVYDYMQ